MPSSRGLSWPTNWTWVSWVAGRFFTPWITWEAPVKQLYPNKKLKKEAGLSSLWALIVPMSWNSEPMILWNYFPRIISPSEMCRYLQKCERMLKKRARGRWWWYYNKWLKNEGRKKNERNPSCCTKSLQRRTVNLGLDLLNTGYHWIEKNKPWLRRITDIFETSKQFLTGNFEVCSKPIVVNQFVFI